MVNVSTEGLLTVSVTANGCCLVFFASNVIFKVLLQLCVRKNASMCKRILELNFDESKILNRMAAEHVVTIATVLLGFSLLVIGDVLREPFLTLDNFTVIEIAFCINIGKYCYKILQNSFLYQHMSLYAIHLIHHLVTVTCFSVFVTYHQNTLLGVVGLTVEICTICDDVSKVMKKVGIEVHETIYTVISVIHCALNFIFRGLVPVSLLSYAVAVHSPFQMHFIPLSFFFLAVIFYSVINMWMIKNSVDNVRKSVSARKECLLRKALDIAIPHSNRANYLATVPQDRCEKLYKNNFHYLKPYSNLNIASNEPQPPNVQQTDVAKVKKVRWSDLVSPADEKSDYVTCKYERGGSISSTESYTSPNLVIPHCVNSNAGVALSFAPSRSAVTDSVAGVTVNSHVSPDVMLQTTAV